MEHFPVKAPQKKKIHPEKYSLQAFFALILKKS